MPRVFALGILALLLASRPSDALGGFVINIGKASVAAGGNSTVDVTITDTSGTGDNLALTAFQFQITPSAGTTSALDFSTSQANSGLTSANYVFFGDSGDFDTSQTLGVATTPTLYTGGDNTADFANVNVTSSTTFLLARLDLTSLTGTTAPQPGDSFTISLVSDPSFTFFLDNQFNSTGYTVNSGTILVTPSVPEPSSVVLALPGVALVALAWYGWRPTSITPRGAG